VRHEAHQNLTEPKRVLEGEAPGMHTTTTRAPAGPVMHVIRRLRAVALLAAIVLAVLNCLNVPAGATATAPHWLIKGQDMADNGSPQSLASGVNGIGLAAQAHNDGVMLPPPTWQLCGVWNGTTYGQSDYTTCAAGGTLVTESYASLKHAITSGLFTATGITTALIDLESWSYTPADEQANVPSTITSTARLASASGIRLIVSTGGTFAKCAVCWRTAAKAGAYAYMVAAQTQGGTSLPNWEANASSAVNTVRSARVAAGTSTLIMLGLATNTPAVHPVSLLLAEWSYGTNTLGVQNYWLNANNWQASNLCTAADGGPGCPEIGVQFLLKAG
jgi:hypothetical protein